MWLPHLARQIIPVRADRNAVCDFDLRQLPFAAHVHFDPLGVQHVILKSSQFHIVLIVDGPLVTMGPVRLHFTASGLESLDRHLAALGALAHQLLDRRLAGAVDRPGPVDRIRLRNAVIALDGELAGATRREIATAIYGADRVAVEWTQGTGSMKATVKRHVARGRRYAVDAYRSLVAAGTFASVA